MILDFGGDGGSGGLGGGGTNGGPGGEQHKTCVGMTVSLGMKASRRSCQSVSLHANAVIHPLREL